MIKLLLLLIQTELFYNYDGVFLFSTHKSSDYASSAKLK